MSLVRQNENTRGSRAAWCPCRMCLALALLGAGRAPHPGPAGGWTHCPLPSAVVLLLHGAASCKLYSVFWSSIVTYCNNL